MSQTVRFTEVNGAFYPEVFTAYPDEEETVAIVKDMVNDGFILECDGYYEVVTKWYEIGEGESGMDTYFADEQLIEFHNKGYFEEMVKTAGYEVYHIENEIRYIRAEDVSEK